MNNNNKIQEDFLQNGTAVQPNFVSHLFKTFPQLTTFNVTNR